MASFVGEGYTAAPMAFPQCGLLLQGRRGTVNSPKGSSEGGDDRKLVRDDSRVASNLGTGRRELQGTKRVRKQPNGCGTMSASPT
jgi:hypothetical protein